MAVRQGLRARVYCERIDVSTPFDLPDKRVFLPGAWVVRLSDGRVWRFSTWLRAMECACDALESPETPV